ncbi:MAG: cbb3-type cytochrome c oxidase subunit II [Chloroflexi bacterium]|nr:cbb3-type cytochrome c oxidase subunit II [Chloroflexota bacterium]
MQRPNLSYLTVGSLLFLLLGLLVTAGIPALERIEPSERAVVYTPQQAQGRAIYLREGCWYCHSQQVRAPEVGIGTVLVRGDIGPESVPGDYAYQKPVSWGTSRQGPDLSHVASRPYASTRQWQLEHLKDPQRMVPGSLMPSYAHLPAEELEALVAYLLTLK